MRGKRAPAVVVALCLMTGLATAAHGSSTAANVQVDVLSTFTGEAPGAVAATNTGDVVALAGPNLVRIGPNGKQNPLPVTISGGAFGFPIGIAYDSRHQLYVALPGSFAPPAQGTVFRISANGKEATPVPGSEGMVAPDGFGLDASTGNLYVTDIFGNSIWRITPDGTAHLWTSIATNPLLEGPDGVKVFDGAVYTSIGSGKILRIPINPDGSAGTATVWAQIAGGSVFFDDMVIDDRTGDVYVTRLDTNELLRITPAGTITPVATHADGLLGAANMVLIHHGHDVVIYLANSDFPGLGGNTDTGGAGPAVFEITIAP